MITSAYITSIIAQAQRAAGEYAYRIAQKVANGGDPDTLWKKLRICIDVAEVLNANNDLTNAEKQYIVEQLIQCTNATDYGATPLTFPSITVVSEDCACDFTGYLTTLELQNAVFVAKNGSDSTGVRNKLDKPFLTLTAAQAAAVSGDTIVVYPGVYTDNSLGKDGVDYYFLPGASVLTTGNIFNVSSAMSFNIHGFGDFNSSDKFIAISAAGTFNITCNSITQTGAYGVEAVCSFNSGCVVNMNVFGKILCSDRGINVTTGSKVYIKAKNVEAARLAFSNEGGSAAELYVTADDILITGSSANTDSCVVVIGDGYTEVRARMRVTNASSTWGAIALNTSFSGTIKTWGDVSTSASAAFDMAGTVTGTWQHEGDISGGTVNCTLANSTINIKGDIISSVNAGPVVVVSNGTARFNGLISNTYSDASSHVITKSGGTLILDDVRLVATHASANSVYAGSAQTVIVYGSYANRSKHANVTESVDNMTIDSAVV